MRDRQTERQGMHEGLWTHTVTNHCRKTHKAFEFAFIIIMISAPWAAKEKQSFHFIFVHKICTGESRFEDSEFDPNFIETL